MCVLKYFNQPTLTFRSCSCEDGTTQSYDSTELHTDHHQWIPCTVLCIAFNLHDGETASRDAKWYQLTKRSVWVYPRAPSTDGGSGNTADPLLPLRATGQNLVLSSEFYKHGPCWYQTVYMMPLKHGKDWINRWYGVYTVCTQAPEKDPVSWQEEGVFGGMWLPRQIETIRWDVLQIINSLRSLWKIPACTVEQIMKTIRHWVMWTQAT